MIKTINPLHDDYSVVELVDYFGSDTSVIRAARVSTNTDNGNRLLSNADEKLIEYLIEHDHLTPFEHNTMTFHISCPLFVARQWMRHRIGWSYNEISRRYTSGDVIFFMPEILRAQADTDRQASDNVLSPNDNLHAKLLMNSSSKLARDTYNLLLDMGVAKEQARMVLPQSMYTRFYTTTNLRALMHFVLLRASRGAQVEIRAYANAMGNMAKHLFPVSWRYFELKRKVLD